MKLKKIYKTIVVKSQGTDVFNAEMMDNIEAEQRAGRECNVQFQPLMQPNGKPLYIAMIEVYE